jgi:hypothetical protein
VPTVLIASTEFASLGHGEAAAFGLPSLPLVLVQHPFGTLSPEKARLAGDDIMDEIVFAATGPTQEVEKHYRENVPKPSKMKQDDYG